MGGLSLMVRSFESNAPRPFDRLLVEVLPELPELHDWPNAFLQRLETAHAKLSDEASQRDALVELAYLYHANGFVQQAESCYLGLESFEAKSPLWPYLLGVLKADRRDKKGVAAHFRRALSLDPSVSLVYLRLGHAYREGGELAAARSSYEKRLLGAPGDGWALVALGELALLEGDVARALEVLLQARAANPDIALIYDFLPEIYLDLGDFEAARAIRLDGESRSLLADPYDERLRFLAGHCFNADRLRRYAREARLRGELQRALELLERALDIGLDPGEAAVEMQEIVSSLNLE